MIGLAEQIAKLPADIRVHVVRVTRSALSDVLLEELNRTDTKDIIRNSRVAQALGKAIKNLNDNYPEADDDRPEQINQFYEVETN